MSGGKSCHEGPKCGGAWLAGWKGTGDSHRGSSAPYPGNTWQCLETSVLPQCGRELLAACGQGQRLHEMSHSTQNSPCNRDLRGPECHQC